MSDAFICFDARQRYTCIQTYLEKEIELRSEFYQYDNNQPDKVLHRLGVGYGFSSIFFAEIYFVGEKEQDGTLTLDAYELEAKWQLAEQGEYLFDWAFLFEFEDKKNTDVFELATTLVSSVDVGRWTGIANLSLIYEWSEDIQNEFETALSVQWRYRYKREIEAGLEFYLAQDTKAIGPILMGTYNLGGRKKLFWDLAAIYGLESGHSSLTPDLTIKGSLEFEF